MKELLKKTGRGTLALIAVVLLVILLVAIEKITKMDWKLFGVIGVLSFAFRWLHIWERIKADEVEWRNKPATANGSNDPHYEEYRRLENEGLRLRKEEIKLKNKKLEKEIEKK